MKYRKIKLFLFFILLFSLLYLEDRIFLGGVSLSNIWKTVIIFTFLFYSFDRIYRNNQFNFLSKTIFFLSISLLIGSAKFNFSQVQEIITLLILPISYYTFYFNYRNNFNKLKEVLLYLSCFLILSSLPFIFGILESLKTDILEAELYGLEKGVLVGLFKHPSLSSKIFVFSTLYIYIYATKSKIKLATKFFLGFVIICGLYSIYLSFTRTGWVMLLFGVLLAIFHNKNFISFFTKVIPFLIILLLSVFYLYNNNETIQRRIKGDRIGRENSKIDAVTLITSGRDILIINAINSVKNEGWTAITFGLGKDLAVKKNDDTLAHNRFVEIFQYGGLISLLLFVIYLYAFFKEFYKKKNNSIFYKLSLIFFFLLLASLIPSHGLPLWSEVLFGGIVALNRIYFENELQIRKIKSNNA